MNINILEFIDTEGKSPFSKWFDDLNAEAAAKITKAMYRLANGNFSNVESVGEGVHEYKIHFGPGYRIYFGQDSDTLVILLAGGTKKGQNKDIKKAKETWQIYKKLKKSTKRGILCH